VTHLRQIMLEELRRRNYAESTIQIYIHTVGHFSRHLHRSPDQLGPEQIRQYQAALFTRWKLSPNTVIQRLAALRFFLCGAISAPVYPHQIARKARGRASGGSMTIFAGGSLAVSAINGAGRQMSVAFCAIPVIAYNTMAATDSRAVPFELAFMFCPPFPSISGSGLL